MGPKKKDKGKLSDWMQCSLCEKLVSSQDAEVHSKSCDSHHGHIQGKVFHGKVMRTENCLKDGTNITSSIKDKDSVVWLANPTMQICGLATGQPCIVNGVQIKRSWPHKPLPLATAALTTQSMDQLGTKEDDIITVERFFPNNLVVQSAVLQLRKPNRIFESAEFLSFAAAYLDGKYIKEGSPLTVKYFGQVCQCYVSSMVCEPPFSKSGRKSQGHVSSPLRPNQTLLNFQPINQTPQRKSNMDANLLTQSNTPHSYDGSTSLCTPGEHLSDSARDLDLSSLTISNTTTATPEICKRDNFPNLMTPIKLLREFGDSDMLPSDVFARVSSKLTTFSVLQTRVDNKDQKKMCFTKADIGGLQTEFEELKRIIATAHEPYLASRCILLHGPSGTGKSCLVSALTHDLGMNTVHITGTDIWSKLSGEAEKKLQKLFKSAQAKAPCIIVIDKLDMVCPKLSQNLTRQEEQKIVETLITLLEDINKIKTRAQVVVVIGITSNIYNIDEALRRAGRFDCEVEIGVPTAAQRQEILEILLSKVSHDLTTEDIQTVARNAHGYVGADLCALVTEAGLQYLNSQEVPPSSHPPVKITMNNLVLAGLYIKPSALLGTYLEVDEVKWTDIEGRSEVKMSLFETIELPLSHPEVCQRFKIPPLRGLLMYGPPGCSKTMIARALATECKFNFLAVKGPELFNQYVGESEKAIREVFHKARASAPSIIFFDEIDAIGAKRGSSSGGSGVEDRVLTQLLTEMGGFGSLKGVFILAATNRPDKLDQALIRPGRFDRMIYVPLPDAETRREILKKKLIQMHVDNDVSLESLVEATHSYSCAEIVQVCTEAAEFALREDIRSQFLHVRHFDAALKKVIPQITSEQIEIYNKFSELRIK